MSYMFNICGGLKTLTFGDNWDTSNVTDMTSMFAGCWELASLDLSSFETSKVTNMNNMFYDCESLTSLTLGNGWDTSKVTDMSFMFSYTGLTTLDLSGWNTSNVTNMSDMFEECRDLTSLNLGNWDTSSVTDMSYMFNCCYDLTSLNLGNGWDTSSLTNVTSMFENTGLSKSVTANEGETGEYWATFYDKTTGYNYQAPEGTKVFKVALAGSTTPASTAPAPTWQRAPTMARPPRTAPMSIMVPSPTTAPMLMTAPIMMTALSPISTRSRMIAPGSMRAFTLRMSSSGTPELRRSHSTTRSSMASA